MSAATKKQEAPSLVEQLDQLVDRRTALMQRRFELEGQLPQLRQAWAEAAATSDPADDSPAQASVERAERELKNIDAAALPGLDQKIETTRQEIAASQRRATVALAQREAKAMGAEAQAMEESFATFLAHAKRFLASHLQVRQLIGAGDQAVAVAYRYERQMIEAGFPDLLATRKVAYLHGAGSTATEAAEAMVAQAESTR